MLLNLSEDYLHKKDLVEKEIGKPFDLRRREELQGTWLKNVGVTAASLDIYNLMVLNESPVFCSIEMRTEGISISFPIKKETYALLIPFYKLRLYKGKAEEYSFYKDHYFIKIKAAAQAKEVHNFIKKLRNFKTDNASPRIEDL